MLFACVTLSGSGLRSETPLTLGSGKRIPGWLCGRFDLLHGDHVGSWMVVAAVNLLPSRQQRRGEEGLGVWGKGPWGLMAPSPRTTGQ
jgi:hypothetical protein